MNLLRWSILCLIGCGMSAIAHAQMPGKKAGQECFPQKDDRRLVYDVADVLNASDEQALEAKLQGFATSTSNQIVVVIVPDLCGMERGQFAFELGELWGVGQEKMDNGVVFLVKPKTPESRGEYFIATGRGLEAAIPDAQTYLIAENEMLPEFRQQNYYSGIDKATGVLMELARGEYNIEQYAQKHKKQNKGKATVGGAVLLFLVIMGLFFYIRSREVRKYAQRNSLGFWAAWWLLSQSGRSHSGYYNSFRSGSGGFGGFGGGGGGGFGGFGGGSFGGGGSGGSW
jgi:uncharacterized protein